MLHFFKLFSNKLNKFSLFTRIIVNRIKKSITLNEQQFTKLFTLTFLGNWIINNQDDNIDSSIDKTLIYLTSYAEKFGFKINTNDENLFEISSRKEFKIDEYIFQYNENTFWNELIYKLVSKEMYKKYGADVLEMSSEDYIEKSVEFEEKYKNEFKKNGLDNLKL